MLLPIGRKTTLKKLPWFTIGLIVINFYVFFNTYPDENKFEKYSQSASQIVLFLTKNESGLDAETQALLRKESEASNFPTALTDEIIQSIQEGKKELLPIGTVKSKWNYLYNNYMSLKTKYGFTPGEYQSVFMKYGFSATSGMFPNIFSYQFLHNGFSHILFNLLFLWIVGCNIEEIWGPIIFLCLYFIGGATAGLAQNLLHPNSSIPMIGASGAVASIMGAFLIRYPTLKIRVLYFVFGRIGIMEMPSWVIIPLWFLQQVFMTLMTLPYAPHVGYMGHIGGFVFGAAGGITIKVFNIGAKWEKDIEKTEGAIEEKLEKGRSELRFDNFDEAEKIFKEILQIDPKQADAYIGLLDLYEKKKDIVTYCTKAAELIGIYYANAELVLASNTLYRVKPVVETVKLPDPIILKFGGYYEKNQQYLEAANMYRAIIKGNSSSYCLPKALFQLGTLLKEKLDNVEDGVMYLERLLNPTYALEWENAVKEILKKE